MAGHRNSRRLSGRLQAVVWTLAVTFAVLGADRSLVGQPASAQQSPAVPGAVPGDVANERARVLDALFMSLKASGDDAEAEVIVAEIWEVWMRSGRPEVDRILNEGVGYLALRQLGPAHDRFTEAIEAAPDFAEAWNKRATVLYLMNEHDRSLADIEKVIALEPRHFGALAGRATIHAHAGRWKEALTAFRLALAVNPFLKERETVLPDLERRVEGERL
jgi:tetratricopeptide (TPR) repeat protein